MSHALRSSPTSSHATKSRWWEERCIVMLWVPAEELAEFNRHIVGLIEVTQRFGDIPEQQNT